MIIANDLEHDSMPRNKMCLCGRVGVRKKFGEWACQRCLDWEKDYHKSYHGLQKLRDRQDDHIYKYYTQYNPRNHY